MQIRTRDMHEIAELGVAAHWIYKQEAERTDGPQYRWLRELLDILDHASGPEEFLEHTKLEMFQDQVFVFTPKGDLIALPRGATPVDFAYAVHSQIGDTCVGAKINGRLLPLRTELVNGDQVEIVTSKAQNPIADLGAVRRHRQGARPHPPLYPHPAARPVSRPPAARHCAEGVSPRGPGICRTKPLQVRCSQQLNCRLGRKTCHVAVGEGSGPGREVVSAKPNPSLPEAKDKDKVVPLVARARRPHRASDMAVLDRAA